MDLKQSLGFVSQHEPGERNRLLRYINLQLIANGWPSVLDEGEAGLESIAVLLYSGACPPDSEAVARVLTTDLGFYQFSELVAGDYCVAIDPGAPPNPANLGDGRWTFPGLDIATITVTLEEDEVRSAVDFGWDTAE